MKVLLALWAMCWGSATRQAACRLAGRMTYYGTKWHQVAKPAHLRRSRKAQGGHSELCTCRKGVAVAVQHGGAVVAVAWAVLGAGGSADSTSQPRGLLATAHRSCWRGPGCWWMKLAVDG